MRDVGDQDRADVAGDLSELFILHVARIGGGAAEDDLGLVLARQRRDLIEVGALIVLAHAVLHGVEEVAGDGDLPAVREVTACGEAQAHDGVAGATERVVHGEVGR